MAVAETATNTLIERTDVISSQNRVYTQLSDRVKFGMLLNRKRTFEISEAGEGVKESITFVAKINDDGEFFIPVDVMDELDLGVGDEICYRIY